MKTAVKHKILIALALCALLSGSAALYLHRALFQPMPGTAAPVVIEVSPGSSLSRVGTTLQQRKLLAAPRLLNLLARYRGVSGQIKPGEYEITPGLSAAQLLDKMVAGDNVQYRVTLVEGWTFSQALQHIWEGVKIVKTLERYDPELISALLQLDVSDPEGMLFPDTYFYTAGTTDVDLLRRAHGQLESVLLAEWDNRLGALPYDNHYDALILASIVEKESAQASERGHIAGVFIRRLEQGMRLQSDPTVIYGMGADFNGNLTRANLQAETPYNTYRNAGLPPTPIALAGLDSIKASLNPIASDYLYFVATGDGGHYFSSSLEEHNAAVSRYQLLQTEQESL
ncbi:MAG: endolytic transglycosylase MltG [Gammaproteobacteria bacterium]